MFVLDILIAAYQVGCSLLPVNQNDLTEGFGVFAQELIPQHKKLWKSGSFNVSHETVCQLVGIVCEGAQGTNKQKGKKKKKRHIHSFLHNGDFTDETDFGSVLNNTISWCDLVASPSPTLFLNSISTESERHKANVIFVIEKHNGVLTSVVKTTRDIEVGEQIMGTYWVEDEAEPAVKRQRTSR